MYADKITESMRFAIDETNRRREIQSAHNDANAIIPISIVKSVKEITSHARQLATAKTPHVKPATLPKSDLVRLVKDLEKQMKKAARELEFEKAALLRDQVVDLRKVLVGLGDSLDPEPGKEADLAPTAVDGVPEELINTG